MSSHSAPRSRGRPSAPSARRVAGVATGMSDGGEPTPRGAVRLGRVAGVPVFVGPSWFVMAVVITFLYGQPLVLTLGQSQAYVVSASFAVLLGVSVLLHELGHCLVARAFHLPVRRITVNFLAGATEVTQQPQTPAREYSVAVAGPMVSLLLAGIGVGLLPLFDRNGLTGRVVENIAITNGLIAAFNLLPGLPLDGGRVLRSVVWAVLRDPDRATRIAAWAGRGVAVVVVPFVFVVLLPWAGYGADSATNLIWAALIAAYIYSLATATLKRSQAMTVLPTLTVARLARPALRVPADMPLSEAVRRAHEANARGLVVVDAADKVEAVVSEAA